MRPSSPLDKLGVTNKEERIYLWLFYLFWIYYPLEKIFERYII